MKYQKFLNEIKRELGLRMLKKGETSILDRLQIHIDNLDNKDYGLDTLLNPNNIKHELYVSMLYQIVYPAKESRKKRVFIDDVEIPSPGKDRNYIINIINILEVEEYKKWKKLENPEHFKSQQEYNGLKGDDLNKVKKTKFGDYFDTSFNGHNPTPSFPSFVKRLNNSSNRSIIYKNTLNTFIYE